jgi:hypothetical protein
MLKKDFAWSGSSTLGSVNRASRRTLRGFENESLAHARVDLSRIFNSLLEDTRDRPSWSSFSCDFEVT